MNKENRKVRKITCWIFQLKERIPIELIKTEIEEAAKREVEKIEKDSGQKVFNVELYAYSNYFYMDYNRLETDQEYKYRISYEKSLEKRQQRRKIYQENRKNKEIEKAKKILSKYGVTEL